MSKYTNIRQINFKTSVTRAKEKFYNDMIHKEDITNINRNNSKILKEKLQK